MSSIRHPLVLAMESVAGLLGAARARAQRTSSASTATSARRTSSRRADDSQQTIREEIEHA